MGTLTKLTQGMDRGSATAMSSLGHVPSDTVEVRPFGDGLVFMSTTSSLSVKDSSYTSEQGASFPARKLFQEGAIQVLPKIIQLAFQKKLTVLHRGDRHRVFVGSLDGTFRTILAGSDWLKVEKLLKRKTVQNVNYSQPLNRITRDLLPEIKAAFAKAGEPIKPLELDLLSLPGIDEFFSPALISLESSISEVTSLPSVGGGATLESTGVPFVVEDNEALLGFNATTGLTSFDVDFVTDWNFAVVQAEKNVDYSGTRTMWGLGNSASTNNFFILQYYNDFVTGDPTLRILARTDTGTTLISNTFLIPDTDPMYTVAVVRDGIVNVWFRQTHAIIDFDVSGQTFDFDNYSVGVLRRTSTIFPSNSDVYANGYARDALPDSQRLAVSQALEKRYGIASS